MQEFMKGSEVMNKEIDLTRVVVAEEQKKERKLQERKEKMYLKEKELLREPEERNVLQTKSMQEEHERKIKSLKHALA